jgi:hypothetical protein
MKIVCKTLFDCRSTGVTGHFKPSQIPFRDHADQLIDSQVAWTSSRNQQRNWETLLQILSLRTQPTVTQTPVFVNGVWQFEFETASDGVYSTSGNMDDLGALYQDCGNVPMIVNSHDQKQQTPVLLVSGPNQNIWFTTVNT